MHLLGRLGRHQNQLLRPTTQAAGAVAAAAGLAVAAGAAVPRCYLSHDLPKLTLQLHGAVAAIVAWVLRLQGVLVEAHWQRLRLHGHLLHGRLRLHWLLLLY